MQLSVEDKRFLLSLIIRIIIDRSKQEKFCSEELVNEYSKTYEIRWSDLDANGHVNYSAYINAAGEVRYHFFWEHGFPPGKFEQLGSGPVYTAIHAEFLREVRLGETVTITYVVSGLSPQGGRWRVQHDVLKANGKKAVSLEVEGVILDLTTRKPVLPSPELLEMFQHIPRAKNFEVLSEMNRRNRASLQSKYD